MDKNDLTHMLTPKETKINVIDKTRVAAKSIESVAPGIPFRAGNDEVYIKVDPANLSKDLIEYGYGLGRLACHVRTGLLTIFQAGDQCVLLDADFVINNVAG